MHHLNIINHLKSFLIYEDRTNVLDFEIYGSLEGMKRLVS